MRRKQSTHYFFRAILKRGIITQGKNIVGEINKQRDGLVKVICRAAKYASEVASNCPFCCRKIESLRPPKNILMPGVISNPVKQP